MLHRKPLKMSLTLLLLLVMSCVTISVGAQLTVDQIIEKELAWIRNKAEHYKKGFRVDHPARIIDDILLQDHQLAAGEQLSAAEEARPNLRGA